MDTQRVHTQQTTKPPVKEQNAPLTETGCPEMGGQRYVATPQTAQCRVSFRTAPLRQTFRGRPHPVHPNRTTQNNTPRRAYSQPANHPQQRASLKRNRKSVETVELLQPQPLLFILLVSGPPRSATFFPTLYTYLPPHIFYCPWGSESGCRDWESWGDRGKVTEDTQNKWCQTH